MSSAVDGAFIRDLGIGLGVLLMGVGIFVMCSALARTFARLNSTLDEVDRLVAGVRHAVEFFGRG